MLLILDLSPLPVSVQTVLLNRILVSYSFLSGVCVGGGGGVAPNLSPRYSRFSRVGGGGGGDVSSVNSDFIIEQNFCKFH